MRSASNVISIVQPAIDVQKVAADIRREVDGLATDEAQIARSGESAAARRVAIGKMLARVRPQWPERGPRAKGWGEFLESVGLAERTARDYMALAGFSATVAETSPAPTYREAGLDRRPRKADVEEDDEPAPRRRRADLPGPEYAPGTAKRTRPTLELLAELDDVLDEALSAWPSDQSLKPAVDLLEKKLKTFKTMHGMRRE